jgi:hypothetical protein
MGGGARGVCQSGFTIFSSVSLLEQYRCGFFVGGGFGLLVASYEGIRWTQIFTGFRPPERNTLRPRVNEVVLLCLSARLRRFVLLSVSVCVCPRPSPGAWRLPGPFIA